ncbi:MAG TPA: hypothetical protein VMW27_20070 [Thermoanaerobaculia bacterium]|nr:hypothetical protein [Thermoanaerobaculia bacterium]
MKTWNKCAKLMLIVVACLLVASPALMAAPKGGLTVKATGTVPLPPVGGQYISPADIHAWLASGVELTAELKARHGLFRNIKTAPGGKLGGEVENFDSDLTFEITGTGKLEGWSHTVTIPTSVETHTGARKEGDKVQSFETSMERIEGSASDDVFESIEVVAGGANGFDSPGKTTLTDLGDGTWLVESSFDIKYSLKFKGAKGGPLEGVEGVTGGVIEMVAVPAD